MPTWAYIVGGIILAIGPGLTALVLLRKAPAETRKLSVDTVDVHVKIAGEAAHLAEAAMHREAAAAKDDREELAALRRDFDQYRRDTDARLAEMAIEVRAARAGEVEAKRQSKAYREENTILRGRVDELEREVAGLKSNDHREP